MQIKQWEDKGLSHFSYAILSQAEKKVILIDPSRNPQPYIDFAKANDAQITGVIETHPHADFVSSHAELHQVTGATIYTSRLSNAAYPHTTFDDGDAISLGRIELLALNTPGHSPDSISILLKYDGKQHTVFSGDTLFIGDCGRPDLREHSGKSADTKLTLAQSMYYSLRDKLMSLNDEVILYPAHGAGTLCGKSVSKANSSTIGLEKQTNWSLQPMHEDEFAQKLLNEQPFIPNYFSYNVILNTNGAAPFKKSIAAILVGNAITNEADVARLHKGLWIVDARFEKEYKKGHLPASINLMEGDRFETWLGSIIKPGEAFYLAGNSSEQLKRLTGRSAAIGYEGQIAEAFVLQYGTDTEEILDLNSFSQSPESYTIIDVRNKSEVLDGKPFRNSISVPLPEVRKNINEIPADKPVVVHCAGGYRSAAASSIIKSMLKGKVKVFDLGEAVKNFINK